MARKKSQTRKPASGSLSKISQSEYNKLRSGGWLFADREMNAAAVRANQRANMYMTPGMGFGGRRTAKGPPPRPMNPNAMPGMPRKNGGRGK